MRVCFVGFVDEFGCACAPFLGGVAIFSHEAEEKIEEVVRGIRVGVLLFRLGLRLFHVLCPPMPCGIPRCNGF